MNGIKRIRRAPIYLLLLTLVLGLLCGCHGARTPAAFEIPADFDDNAEVEIIFWAKNDTNRTQVDIYEKAIADFEALYPNIHVKLRLYTDYSVIYNDVITNIPTQTTPNVCITYPDHIATYLTGADTVVPLDALMDDPSYGLGGSALRFDSVRRDEIVPQFLSECAFAEHTYALPYMRSTEACYVNKTYVEALGYTLPDVLTWDFIWEVSEAAMAKGADGNFLVNGQDVLIPFIYKSTDNMMIQMTRQLDSPYSSDDGEILLFNDTTRSLMYTVEEHAASQAFSTFKMSGYPANFLNAGECIFAVDSTAGATWMGTDAPLLDISADRIVEFETAVYPVPQFDPAHPKMISQGPSLCIFNKADRSEVMASWIFAQYLLTSPVQIAYSSTEGYVPVTLRAQQSAEYQDYLSRAGEDDAHYAVKIAASRLLLEHMEDTFVTPVFNGSASLRSAAGQLIENAVKAGRRSQPLSDESIEQLYADVRSLYRLDSQSGMQSGGELGPLPAESRALLIVLGCVWIGLGAGLLTEKLRQGSKNASKKSQ